MDFVKGFALVLLTMLVSGANTSPTGKNIKSRITGREKRAIVVNSEETRTWDMGEVPYTFAKNTATDMRTRVLQAMEQITNVSCVVFRDVEFDLFWMYDYVHERKLLIDTSDPNLCYAQTGFSATYGDQPVNLGANCATDIRIPVMVLMDSLGFFLENRRPDRADYIIIKEDNIDRWPREVFNILSGGVMNSVDYDYDVSSVMQQPGTFLQKDAAQGLSMIPRLSLLQRSDDLDNLGGRIRSVEEPLSHRDAAAINRLYKCSRDCAGQTKVCQNGGYQKIDCGDCVCPPGLKGSLCETLDLSDTTNGNCGGTYTASTGTVSSGYPAPYNFGSTCRWMIKASDPDERVCIRIDDLDFHGPDEYDQLWVNIYGPDVDLYSLSYNDLDSYKGKWYKSQTDIMTVLFQSSTCDSGTRLCGSQTHKGFQLSYNTGCVGIEIADLAVPEEEVCEADRCVTYGECQGGIDLATCGCIVENPGQRCASEDGLKIFELVYPTTKVYTSALADQTSDAYKTMYQRVCKLTYDGFRNSPLRSAYVPCSTVIFTERDDGTTNVNYRLGFNRARAGRNVDVNLEEDFDLAEAQRSSADVEIDDDVPMTIALTGFNECQYSADNTCHSKAACVNEDDGYTCECLDGYLDVSSDRRNEPGRKCTAEKSTDDDGEFDWKWIVIALAIVIILALIICPIMCCMYARRGKDIKYPQPRSTQYYSQGTSRTRSTVPTAWSGSTPRNPYQQRFFHIY